MRKSKYTEEQIIGFLKQAEAGVPVKDLCRKEGFSDATFYKWRSKFGGMEVPDAWLAAPTLHLGEHLVSFDRDFRKLVGRSQFTLLEPAVV